MSNFHWLYPLFLKLLNTQRYLFASKRFRLVSSLNLLLPWKVTPSSTRNSACSILTIGLGFACPFFSKVILCTWIDYQAIAKLHHQHNQFWPLVVSSAYLVREAFGQFIGSRSLTKRLSKQGPLTLPFVHLIPPIASTPKHSPDSRNHSS